MCSSAVLCSNWNDGAASTKLEFQVYKMKLVGCNQGLHLESCLYINAWLASGAMNSKQTALHG